MKTLLVGPYPPPHGGISVHVRGLEQRSIAAGIATRVLDSNRAGIRFVRRVIAHAWRGWTIHFHTNGHNRKSWLLAGICGVAGKSGAGAVLTLHSGMVPGYLASSSRSRLLARVVCAFYSRIICVSAGIRDAITSIGVPLAKTDLAEAFLGVQKASVPLDTQVSRWMDSHTPLLSTAVFFRPEYGFDLLLRGLLDLRKTYPRIGCVVMGDSEHRDKGAQEIQRLGLQESVLILGDVAHDSCVTVMSRCDLFVRPTLEDGDSVSVREAVGLGVPVVASDVGTRPAEAILFPRGDVASMVAQIKAVVQKAAVREAEYA